MKLVLETIDADLKTLPLRKVTGYLERTGWSRIDTTFNYSLWAQSADALDYTVEVPLDNTYADYYRRIFETIQVIALFENRTDGKVYLDIIA